MTSGKSAEEKGPHETSTSQSMTCGVPCGAPVSDARKEHE